MKRYRIFIPLFLFLFLPVQEGLTTTPVSSQGQVELRVARISYTEGPVTMMRTTDEDWIPAPINTPLLVDDKVYSGIGAKLEIQLEDETTLRLSDETYIHFLSMDDALSRVHLQKGTIAVHADEVSYDRPPFEIVSDTFQALITTKTKARFSVTDDGSAEIQVRRGEVKVLKDERTYFIIQRGERLIIPTPEPSTFATAPVQSEDHFDQWCDLRDAESKAAIVTNAVSPRIAGTPDLQRYGNWLDSPEYGQVWRPRVASSWTPYYDGEWAWREPYGYTWVSYEPWGWVPYHYGRWVHIKRYNWCWVPWETRHVVYRPRWHPALVSFTYANHGRHFNYSLGGGYYNNPCVGWFPLGPRDPFVPWYSLNWTYVDRYTHRYHHIPGAHITNITINTGHTYQNQHLANAITVVPLRDFQSGNYRTKAPVTLAPANRPVVSVGHEALPQLSNRRTIVAKPQRDHVEMTYTNLASSKVASTKQTPESIKKDERDSSTSPVRLSGPRRSLPSAAPSRNTANTATQIQRSTSRNASSSTLSNQNRATSLPRSEVRTAPKTGITPLRNSVRQSPARSNPRAAAQPGSNVITYPRASSQIQRQSPAPARETKIAPSAPAQVQPDRTSKPRVEPRDSAQARPSIPRTNQERQIIINAAQARQTNSLRSTNSRETQVSTSRTTTPPARITTQDIRTTSQYRPQPGIYSTQKQPSSTQRQVSPAQSLQDNRGLSRMRTPNYSTTGRTTYSTRISQPRASSAPSSRLSTSPSRSTSIGSPAVSSRRSSTLSSPSTSSRSSSSYSPARSPSSSQYRSSGYSPSRSSSPSYSSPRSTGASNSRVSGSTSRPR